MTEDKADMFTRGASEEDIQLLRTGWLQVDSNYARAGEHLLKTVLRMQPGMVPYFGEMNRMGTRTTLSSMLVKHLKTYLLGSIHHMVGMLERPRDMYRYCIYLGQFHEIKSIDEYDFEEMYEVLVSFVKSFMSPFTAEMEDAWSRFFAGMIRVIKIGVSYKEDPELESAIGEEEKRRKEGKMRIEEEKNRIEEEKEQVNEETGSPLHSAEDSNGKNEEQQE